MEQKIICLLERIIGFVENLTARIDAFTARVNSMEVKKTGCIVVPQKILVNNQITFDKAKIADALRKVDTKFSVKDLENMRKLG